MGLGMEGEVRQAKLHLRLTCVQKSQKYTFAHDMRLRSARLRELQSVWLSGPGRCVPYKKEFLIPEFDTLMKGIETLVRTPRPTSVLE